MKNNKLLANLAIYGFIFTVIVGALLHFVYEWSGDNFVVGLLAPINESVWEHMKLVSTPMILFAFVDYYYLRNKIKNYCFSLLKQIGVAIVFIIAFFYIYTYFTGDSILFLDIISFIVGVALGKWVGYLIQSGRFKKLEFKGLETVSIMLLIAVVGFFVYVTIEPPAIDLFKDPVTGTYGIQESLKL